MEKFITENGQKEVVINEASFKDAMHLKNVILKQLKESPLKLGIKADIENIFSQNIDSEGVLNFLKEVLLGTETSESFEDAIFKCLEKCTYDLKRITYDLFDEMPDARSDYYTIIAKCIEVNLRPFFKSLVSELKTRTKLISVFQKLTSEPQTET